MKILAIDDNEESLVSVAALVRTCLPGCDVETALSGPEGIEKARALQPDTILLDVRMPDMDAFEACRLLKEDPSTHDIPVIFLTSQHGDGGSRVRALEIGGDAFLTKPVEPGELTAQVRVMVRIKKAEDALRAEKASHERTVEERTGALRESERTLRLMIDAISESVFLMSRDGVLLVVNETFAARVGRRVDECVGRSIQAVVPAEVWEWRRARSEEVLLAGHPVTFEDRNGERWMRHSLFPLLDAAGRVTRVAGFTVDVTEPRRIEETLKEQLDELRRWHEATLGRETRVLELKREVNDLLAESGRPPRYASALEGYGGEGSGA